MPVEVVSLVPEYLGNRDHLRDAVRRMRLVAARLLALSVRIVVSPVRLVAERRRLRALDEELAVVRGPVGLPHAAGREGIVVRTVRTPRQIVPHAVVQLLVVEENRDGEEPVPGGQPLVAPAHYVAGVDVRNENIAQHVAELLLIGLRPSRIVADHFRRLDEKIYLAVV